MKRFAIIGLFVLLSTVSVYGQSGQSVDGTGLVINGKAIIGADTPSPALLSDVLRVVGTGAVSGGSATMRPLVIDNDGDVLRDTNASVSTGGAWQLGSTLGVTGATTLSSTLGVTGAATLSSTLAVTGNTTLTGDLIGGSGTLLIASPTRISGTTPALLLHESDATTDEKYWRLKADTSTLTLQMISDALSTTTDIFNVTRTGMLATDFRLGQNITTFRAQNNGVTNLGSELVRFSTLYVNELLATTFTSDETIIRSGGSEVVVEGSSLTRDMSSSDTCLYVKHNSFRSGDVIHLHKVVAAGWQDEKIVVSSGYVDCRVSGNCPSIADDFAYCTLGRGHDNTGANDWITGDTVMNEGQTGDGWLELIAKRSAQTAGYVGQVISDGPVAYWRMSADTATTTNDVMGNVGVATETGTQSNGLGVLSSLLGTNGSDPVWQNTNAGGYLLVADDTDLRITGDLTLEMWLYWENGGGADNVLSRGANGEYHLQVNADGSLTFCHGNGSSNECESTAASFLPANTYTHIFVIVDAVSSPKRVVFGRNGAIVSSSTYTQSVTAQALSTAIGENPVSTGSAFDGNIDEVAVYNYQVPESRLAIHYAARANAQVSRWTRGPSIYGWTRTGSGAYDVAMRWACGNLAGSDYATSSTTPLFGCGFGNASTSWLSIDATNGVRGMFGSTKKFGITPAGIASFAQGAVTIDGEGMKIAMTDTDLPDRAYRFTGAISYDVDVETGLQFGPGLYAHELSGVNETVLTAGVRSGGNDILVLQGDKITLSALDGTGDIDILASSDININPASGNLILNAQSGNLALTVNSNLVINGSNGFTGSKTAGSCTITFTKGIVTNVTGC